jgi:MFS family permease
MSVNNKEHQWQFITFAAAAMLMVTMGARQSLGLFVAPLNNATGLGIVTISFAMAVGQFVWGAVQPVAGAIADRYGAGRVLLAGVVILSLGSALAPFMATGPGLVLTIGLLSATGSGAASFSVLIGAVARRLPSEHRGTAAGIINAGGSFGQFVFAPLLQAFIFVWGWMGAMWSLAAIVLAALPLARLLRGSQTILGPATGMSAGGGGLGSAVKRALADRSYLLLHASFFTCGFHIAFLVTHLPGEIDLCGLPASVSRRSICKVSPVATRYCFPPVSITAYIVFPAKGRVIRPKTVWSVNHSFAF